MTSTINASTTAGLVQTADTSGVLALQTSGTTAVTVDASQNTTLAGTLATSSRGITKASMPAGTVLQVVSATYSTEVSSTTSTLIDTGVSASITPTSATSKIYVMVTHPQNFKSATTGSESIRFRIIRNSTSIFSATEYLGYTGSIVQSYFSAAFSYLDSPATTSATTYKTQFCNNFGSPNGTVSVQSANTTSTITLMEIAV
jgi:hypothetical protein